MKDLAKKSTANQRKKT